MEKDKRVTIDLFELLVTHKCNLSCGHCLRGQAQNASLTPELADKFFSQVTKIYQLTLSGGEPTLEVEGLKAVLSSIKKYGVKVGMIHLPTNGTNITDEFIDVMLEFKEYIKENRKEGWTKKFEDQDAEICISISADKFHLTETFKKSLTVEQLVGMIGKLKPYFEVVMADSLDQPLVNTGRAKSIKTSEKFNCAPMKTIMLKAEKEEGISYHVGPFVGMDARGNIAHTDCTSFEYIQKHNAGNIADTDLITLLSRYSDKHTTSPAEYVELKEKYAKAFFAQFEPAKKQKLGHKRQEPSQK